MKEMTTAEFAKANLAGLEEPVTIRRYTKTVGVYYPEAYSASPVAMIDMGEVTPEKVEALRLELDQPGPTAAARITELEEEIAHLKRELAKRSQPALAPTSMTTRAKDPFAGLAKQDAEFFERKLGLKAKKR